MNKLHHLPCWNKDHQIHVVVESPRGSGIKYKYAPHLGAFTVSRAFALGITYPFDWGFIPGTQDEDGDPVDALVLHDAPTFPGVVLPCQVLGMIAINQKEDGKTQCNNRIIVKPTWNDRLGNFESPEDLPNRMRGEIEQFFLSSTFFTAKKIDLKGWKGPKAATKFIHSCQKPWPSC